MTTNAHKHQKHAKLARPAYGTFGRNELAVLGTPCGEIQRLAAYLIEHLPERQLAFADADHQPAPEVTAALAFTDKISFHRYDFGAPPNDYHRPKLFNDVDLVLVNGNHFAGLRQVVVIDPRKADSLRRKFNRLTDVRLVLLADGVGEVPADVRERIGADVPVWAFEDFARTADWLRQTLREAVAPLRGLVLVGGKSTRMQRDKGLITYHDRPQRERVYAQLLTLTGTAYVSCRPDQAADIAEPTLPDTFADLGPYGALLSAFRAEPTAAWLVTACDLPFLDEKTLAYLVDNRDASQTATAFKSPENDFPEPLVAIWEPRAYPTLLHFLGMGYSCPRKVLINSPVKLLAAADGTALRNVNTPEEYAAAQAALRATEK